MAFTGKRILIGSYRRHCGVQGRGVGPAADRGRGPGQGGHDPGGPGVRGAVDLRRPHGREGGHGHVRAGQRPPGAHLPGPGGGRHRGGPGHCQSHRQGGRRYRGRSAYHHHAGGHPAGADLPGHERRDVGQSGGAGEPGPAQGPGAQGHGAGRRAPGLRRRGLGPLAGAGPDRGGRSPPAQPPGPGGAAGVGHGRTYP